MRAARLLLTVCAFAGVSACGHLEPWVKPYERDQLADPIMVWDRDATSTEYLVHIYDSREGSRGAMGTSGGGCGCN
jgi:Domain of unknown function (DUF4266)